MMRYQHAKPEDNVTDNNVFHMAFHENMVQ